MAGTTFRSSSVKANSPCRSCGCVLGSARVPPRCKHLAGELPKCQQCPIGHVVDGAGGVDAEQDALVAVVRDQRLRLLLIDLEAVPDDFLAVVIALKQLTTTFVAPVRRRRRVGGYVPQPAAPAAGTPAR